MPRFHRDIKHFPFNFIFLLPEKPKYAQGEKDFHAYFSFVPLASMRTQHVMFTLHLYPSQTKLLIFLLTPARKEAFPKMLLPQFYPTAAYGAHLRKHFYQVEGSQLSIYQNTLFTMVQYEGMRRKFLSASNDYLEVIRPNPDICFQSKTALRC